jgi:hypothetical protein
MKSAALSIFFLGWLSTLSAAAVKTAIINTQESSVQQYFIYNPSKELSGLFVCVLGYPVGEYPVYRALTHDVPKLLQLDGTEYTGTMHAYHVGVADGPLVYAVWLGESKEYSDKVHLQTEEYDAHIYPLYRLFCIDGILTFKRLTIPEFKELVKRFECACLIS